VPTADREHEPRSRASGRPHLERLRDGGDYPDRAGCEVDPQATGTPTGSAGGTRRRTAGL